MQIPFNPADLLQILPWITVTGFAMATLLADVFVKPETNRDYAGYVAIAGIGAAFFINLFQWGNPAQTILFGALRVDNFAVFFNALVLGAAAFTMLMGIGFFREHGLQRGEFYALTLMSLSGMMLMGMAVDMLTFFIALELMSIPIYVLAAYQRHKQESVESSLKYFLMGAFSTAFTLYGIAFVYGAVGATSFDTIVKFVTANGVAGQNYFILGMVFMLIGFCFKVAAVPFHMWTPDVYQGAPTVVTGFMAAAVKAAAFAAFVRIFITVFFPLKLGIFGWYNIIWVVAVLTMTLGNLSALVQDNIKRMLAYSSIAHAGYLLVGFLTITQSPDNNGAASILFYLAAYAVMNLGAFSVVILFGRRGNENLEISKGWAGMGMRAPMLGLAMTIFMLSLMGMPPTGGFMGKFYIFSAALDQNLILLAVIGILNSLISVYYYLRVIVYMYMVEPGEGEEALQPMRSVPIAVGIVAAVFIIMQLGMMPSSALSIAQEAVKSLF